MNLRTLLGRRWRVVLALGAAALLANCSSGGSSGAPPTPCQSDADCDAGHGVFCVNAECRTLSGRFVACTSDAACDTSHGFSCVESECRLACGSHFDCAAVGTCESFAEGTFCKVSTPAKLGQYYTHCPYGDGDCDAANGFVCIGAGPGDLDAYCTSDCQSDTDCGVGFRCGTLSQTPCDDQCGIAGQATTAGCITSDQIGAGKRYYCVEPFGLVRQVCVRRSFCADCAVDEDCLGVAGQICAKDQSGQGICTVTCDPSVPSCPWGDATTCGMWDSARGINTCAHRFGSCHGSGKGCEPCVDRKDCAPTGFCTRTSFTGEQFCVDLSVSCDCGADADANSTCEGHGCPDSPGGLPLICYSGTQQPTSHHCIGANSVSTNLGQIQSGCWN